MKFDSQPCVPCHTVRFKFLGLLLIAFTTAGFAADRALIKSSHAAQDESAETHPNSAFWHKAPGVFTDTDAFGKPVAGHRTEIRSRWTKDNLYLLFICPYQELYLKSDPETAQETNKLWNWDVAETFIGSDFKNIQHYREFELSPQGEWIDLDIHRDKPHHEDGWVWNSGFQVSARIDKTNHIWYGAMRIPYASIDDRAAAAGNTLRVNFYRTQGPPPNRKEVTWRPTMTDTFHTPERFGLMKLVK